MTQLAQLADPLRLGENRHLNPHVTSEETHNSYSDHTENIKEQTANETLATTNTFSEPSEISQIRSLNERKIELETKLQELNRDLKKVTSKLEKHKANSATSTSSSNGSKKRTTPPASKSTPTKKAKTTKKSTAATAKASIATTRPKRTRRKSSILREAETQEIHLSPGLNSCLSVMRAVMSHRWAGPFNVPVDPIVLGIPDYPDIIKHPMDFGTVKSKLEAGEYEDVDDFCADMNLVFSNACTYNRPGSDVYIMAQTIQDFFNKKIRPIQQREEQREKRSQIDPEGDISEIRKSVDSIRQGLQLLMQSQVGKGRNNLSKSVLETPMTKEEMKRLSMAINSLPCEHLSSIVAIIKQKMPHLANQKEIEIDFSILDNATLRSLETYVYAVKRKKNGRKLQMSSSNVVDFASKAIQQVDMQLQSLSPSMGGTIGDAHPENENSSSDSDSSSDSGSESSSDSNSDSGSESSDNSEDA